MLMYCSNAFEKGEIYDGIFASKFPDQQEEGFNRFLQGVTLLSLNTEIMHHFAHLRGQLRRQGLLIGDADLLIASTALHYNLTLLSFNSRHFQRIPDLTLYIGKDQ